MATVEEILVHRMERFVKLFQLNAAEKLNSRYKNNYFIKKW